MKKTTFFVGAMLFAVGVGYVHGDMSSTLGTDLANQLKSMLKDPLLNLLSCSEFTEAVEVKSRIAAAKKAVGDFESTLEQKNSTPVMPPMPTNPTVNGLATTITSPVATTTGTLPVAMPTAPVTSPAVVPPAPVAPVAPAPTTSAPTPAPATTTPAASPVALPTAPVTSPAIPSPAPATPEVTTPAVMPVAAETTAEATIEAEPVPEASMGMEPF